MQVSSGLQSEVLNSVKRHQRCWKRQPAVRSVFVFEAMHHDLPHDLSHLVSLALWPVHLAAVYVYTKGLLFVLSLRAKHCTYLRLGRLYFSQIVLIQKEQVESSTLCACSFILLPL